MRQLTSIPTWAATNFFTMAKLLKKDHPWRGRYFTLRSWHAASTPLCRAFDFAVWMNVVCVILIAIRFLWK